MQRAILESSPPALVTLLTDRAEAVSLLASRAGVVGVVISGIFTGWLLVL